MDAIFSKEAFSKRLEMLRNQLAKKQVDAILITKRENYMYLSGFTGTSAQLVITENDAVLVTDFRYVEQASKQAPLFDIVGYTGDIADEINNILKRKNVKKLGFESENVTYSLYRKYSEKLGVRELVPLNDTVESLRMIKDSEEINYIKEAVRIADEAFEHILKFIKPGVRETEISAELDYFMKKQGGQGPSFDFIVASGTRSAMPHGVASDKIIETGDVITMDYGTIYHGYCSDITRTVFLGEPDKKMMEIYKIVLSAQEEALKNARKGMKGKEVDSIARNIIKEAGYGENFGHSLGHGVGLEIHENPRFAPSSDMVMENGMVVTVEPGIYLEGFGGVRIEDMIIIRDDNPEIITHAPKEPIII